MIRRCCSAASCALLLTASAASSDAQSSRLQEIGKTSIGTPVFLEPRSVSRSGAIVTATVRVRLEPPLKGATGDLRSSRTTAMYDCARQTVATKESWYFLDDAGKKEGMHKVVKIPGYGPAFKGSLADVAMKHLCGAPSAKP